MKREIDRSVFKSHFRRAFDKRWVGVWDTDVFHPGDTFVTAHEEVWEVGERDLDGEAMVKEMQGVIVRRGVTILSRDTVLFNRVHGDAAKEVLQDFTDKIGRLL